MKLETGNTFLGKTKGMKLLIVNFKSTETQEDSVAWIVKDPEKAKAVLTEALT